MKLWERVVEARLRKVVEICEQQYGFMPRKSTTDAIFALRILMEKYRDGQRELHCVFVDLEKEYDRVPREELWYCMRKSGVAEKYVRVVQDMYERSRRVVRCAVGQTEEFKVEVGLHQGSALSPFLFAMVMDQLSEEVRQESPWTMMFADDIVICSESREQVEENLERWRFALERRGMKVSRSLMNLEKAYDRVPREELWYCMRKSGVAEKYVRVVQDMYERSRTVVRCAVGQTEEFNVEVGLHQGSALSPFLFAIVMDQLSEEVRQESPWTMMFADDIVICSESREQVEENLERWRFALERRGMKVSRSKTEYMCVNEREGSGTVRLQGEEVKKVQEFKYLGSTVQSNGECRKEVKKRVQAGWNGWRKVSGVLCDQKISARIKGKVYRTVVRPAMLYGLETVSLRKRQESELELGTIRGKFTLVTGRVGCELEEKERFWSELDEVMESIPTGERVVIGVDFNGHVAEGNTGDEEVMGKFGVKERNLEGQMVIKKNLQSLIFCYGV
ncbi:hypothetical protein QTP70_000451 [Hemibagrus guttatus]|uniref:ribonuclease H n=1 Tax=Hemibagrus guttatus TaxID=175788 RepID=A0AAE0QLG1_9TELE|nr:hypothetical protein QTP70_000451 [Hemibagrus guttatus]